MLVHSRAESITETDSSAAYRINVHAKAESITVTESNADFYLRHYVNDPKKYAKSEPIWIYSKDENLQMILSDDTVPYRDGWFIEQLNGQLILEFEVLANDPAVELIENDGRAIVRNVDGELAEFIIRSIEDIDDSTGTFKRIEAEGGEYELIDEFVSQYKASNVTLKTALGAVTHGTRWTIGTVDDFGTNSVDLRNITVKNAIYELLQIFGGEIRYRVVSTGNQITRRYIDVHKQRGMDTGKRFEAGKDILSTSRLIDTSGIKTALYGRGASRENDLPRIDFADVVWSKADGDPLDKPLGQTWIGDPEALQKWGYAQGKRHRFGFYDGQEEDPGELLLNTYRELLKVKDANETYEINVILLEEITGFSHERVRLGDKTYAVNRRIHPSVEVENSIIEYRQNLNDKSLSEVTLGNFRNAYDISSRFERVEKDINENQGNWTNKPTHEEVENETLKMVNEAIDEAQRRIDEATIELEQAMEIIEQGKIDLQQAEDLIQDTIDNPQNYKGQMVGDIIADSLIVRGPIISIDATITGTILASNATFMRANIEKANIIDANIKNAVITGRLDSVDGIFIGDLIGATIYSQSTTFVGTDLQVTNNISLGSATSSTTKEIRFNNVSAITADWNHMEISTLGWTEIDASSITLTSRNAPVDITNGLNVSGTIRQNGTAVSLSNHNHNGTYARIITDAGGYADIWFGWSGGGNLTVYRNGSYVGYIAVQ